MSIFVEEYNFGRIYASTSVKRTSSLLCSHNPDEEETF
jgi:hypothetical protein